MTQTPETARRMPGLRRLRGVAGLALSGVVVLAGGAAQARDLRVGLSAEPTSMDPHFHNLGPITPCVGTSSSRSSIRTRR